MPALYCQKRLTNMLSNVKNISGRLVCYKLLWFSAFPGIAHNYKETYRLNEFTKFELSKLFYDK